jgi:hypothetical protein
MGRINPYNKTLSAPIPLALMEYKMLSDGAKLLYARLLMYAGQNGLCYPAIETLAKDLAKCPRTIINLLTELKDKGFMEWESPPKRNRIVGKTNKYFFLDHPVIVTALAQGKTGSHVQNLSPACAKSGVSHVHNHVSPHVKNLSHKEIINTRDNIRDSSEETFTWPDKDGRPGFRGRALGKVEGDEQESQVEDDRPGRLDLKPETRPQQEPLAPRNKVDWLIKKLEPIQATGAPPIERIKGKYGITTLYNLTRNQLETELSEYSYLWEDNVAAGCPF